MSVLTLIRPAQKAPEPELVAPRPTLGWLPALALTTACGVALVSVADSLSRRGLPHGEPLFWLGLLLIVVPVAVRQFSAGPSRGERVALLLLLGIATYGVKVLRDPFAFTYADELVHQHNVLTILHSHKLFGDNPILPVTPSYPGLESVTAALASTTGLSTFVCGLIVIGVARAILMLALYLLYEAVTGSARIAGLAAVLYAASPHYLFFTAQFSYESLALPLGVLALYAAMRSRPAEGPMRPAWTMVALVAIAGVVVTHHMTSYALVAVLLAVCVVPMPWRAAPARRPWELALFAAVATAEWLLLAAGRTVGYLSPVLTGALKATFRTAAGEASTRQLFHSASGTAAPQWEHAVGFVSTCVLAAAVIYGALVLWRAHRDSAVALVLGVAGLGYLATLGLRLVPAAWETALRASEFLYAGVALLVALALVRVRSRLPQPALATAAVTGLLVVGAVVSATPHGVRVAQTYRVAVAGGDLDPAGVAVARWTRHALGPGTRIAAEEADARMLLVYGGQHVFAGKNPAIVSVLQTPVLYRWQLDLLRSLHIRYVAVDVRRASASVGVGYFFPRRPEGPADRLAPAAITKFERAGARRVYDAGDIFVDDIQGVTDAAATP